MTDPWELLKEARHYVTQTTTNFERYDRNFLARIDAALAEHEKEMIEHRKNFARDVKDLDRTLAAWRKVQYE